MVLKNESNTVGALMTHNRIKYYDIVNVYEYDFYSMIFRISIQRNINYTNLFSLFTELYFCTH